MIIKFYEIETPNNSWGDEKYIFQTETTYSPQKCDLVYTEDQSYRVADICHVMDYDKEDHYVCYQTDILVVKQMFPIEDIDEVKNGTGI